jgi:hypothetical protein
MFAMACRAIALKDQLAARWVAQVRAICRQSNSNEISRPRPTRFHLIRQYRDLLVRKPAARTLRERRHWGSGHTLCYGVPQLFLANQCEKKWIVQWTGGARMAIAPMAAGAIAPE